MSRSSTWASVTRGRIAAQGCVRPDRSARATVRTALRREDAAGGRWARQIRGSARLAAAARGRPWRSTSRSLSATSTGSSRTEPGGDGPRLGRVPCARWPAADRHRDVHLLKIAASGTREMRYTLPFGERRASDTCSSGSDYVAQDAGLDAWADTDAVHDDLSRRSETRRSSVARPGAASRPDLAR
jgi:hypothetical protein